MGKIIAKISMCEKTSNPTEINLTGDELEKIAIGEKCLGVDKSGKPVGTCIVKNRISLGYYEYEEVRLVVEFTGSEFQKVDRLMRDEPDEQQLEDQPSEDKTITTDRHVVAPITEQTSSVPSSTSGSSTSSVGGQIETVATLAFFATVLMGFLSGMMTGSSGIGLIVGFVCMIPGYISFILVKGYGEIVSNSAKAVDELREIKELMKK